MHVYTYENKHTIHVHIYKTDYFTIWIINHVDNKHDSCNNEKLEQTVSLFYKYSKNLKQIT